MKQPARRGRPSTSSPKPKPILRVRPEVSESINPNSVQIGGTHYQDIVGQCPHCKGVIQHWDLFGMLPYLVGNATKYVTRYALKNGKEDLVKAKHYIDKLIARMYPD